MDLSTALDEEKEKTLHLDASLEAEKERNVDSTKADKLVAQQLKGALDGVQVWHDMRDIRCVMSHH